MKMKLVAAGVAMALSGIANAAYENAASGNSTLILSAWDTANPTVGYIRDLGRYSDVVMSTLTPEAGITVPFAADSLFSSTFAGSNMANVVYNVAAGDGLFPGLEMLTTALSAPSTLTTGAVTTSLSNVDTLVANLNNDGCGTSCATDRPSHFQWNNSLGTAAFDNTTTVGSPINFYSLVPGANSRAAPTLTEYANSTATGTWTLASNGQLTYSIAAAGGSPVPIPAAAWLLGSALIGLVGVARRREETESVETEIA